VPLSKAAIGALDARDRRMAEMILDGSTNKALAAEFGVSFETIKSRLTLMRRRYGTADRHEMARAILRD
jgi:DNA-binding NarL/FixJ family response regulator